jgi:hypothetical protein
MLGSRSRVPDDIKADIARVVRSIKFTGSIGGDCVLRAGIGYVALGLLGFRPQFCVGRLLFGAGPGPLRDTLAFCGPGNGGQMIDVHFIGHVRLELAGELIDFSCGDWRHLDPRSELHVAGMELPPIQWQARPPTFIGATRGLFDDWQPDGSPPIGELWYGPWTGSRPDNVRCTRCRAIWSHHSREPRPHGLAGSSADGPLIKKTAGHPRQSLLAL